MDYLRHLLDGRVFEIPGVDPAEYQTLAGEIYEQFAPHGPAECFHVDMLVYNVWTYCRLLRFQDQCELDAGKPGVKAALDYSAKRLPALEQSYARTVKDLRALQKKRREEFEPLIVDHETAEAAKVSIAAAKAATRKCGDLASFRILAPTLRPRRNPPKKTATGESIH